MRHDWILEVLTDLLSYSQRNGLQGLAHSVEGALEMARAEIDAEDTTPDVAGGGGEGGGGPPKMRRQ